MAAIIAQMSLRNRERKKRRAALGRRGETGSDKCVYTLPPFDQCYDPLLHNKYVRAKRRIEKRNLVINQAKCKYTKDEKIFFVGYPYSILYPNKYLYF